VATVDGPIAGTGDRIAFMYDSARRLTTVVPPISSNTLTRYCYDDDGQLVGTNRYRLTTPVPSDPNASTAAGPGSSGKCAATYPVANWQSEIRSYFPTGDLKSLTDAAGNVVLYAYDAVGRQQVAQDADGRQVATVYDAAGQTVATWHGGAGWITTDGNQLPSVGANALATSVWTPSNYTGVGQLRYAYYQYTPNGKQDYLLDANNNKTDYYYDGLDRLEFTLLPNAATGSNCVAPANDSGTPICTAAGGTTPTYEKYTYDAVGNRTGLRTRLGDSMVYHVDSLNRLDSKTPAGLGVVTTGFNLLDQPLSVNQAAGGSHGAHTTQYTYDAAGRTLSETNDGRSALYQYDTLVTGWDNAGNRTRTTWPDGYFVTYQYDALNRMTYVRENSVSAGEVGFYHYDPLSRRDYMCQGGQSATCATTATNKVAYSYETDSDLNALTHSLNTTTLALTYLHNHSHQLTNIMASDSTYLPGPAIALNSVYSSNALNQYATVGGQSSTFDLNGNLLTWYPASGKQTYTYDSENRLVTAAVNGSATATISYDYDGLGRRVKKTVGGVVTQYLLDGNEEIAELDGAGTVLRRYITGPQIDDRIARAEGNAISNPTKFYYHVNHQGSVLATTNAAGTLQQQITYDEYGNSNTAVTGEQFRYTGRRFDSETGLYYYRARYYAPQLGRFLMTDPVGYASDLNLYAYVGNDPTDLVDPTGLYNCEEGSEEYCDLIDLAILQAQKALKKLHGKERETVQEDLKLLGTRNDGNNVTVVGGETNFNAPIQTDVSNGKATITINYRVHNESDLNQRGISAAGGFVHEGQHIHDAMKHGGNTPNNEHLGNANYWQHEYDTERQARIAESYVLKALQFVAPVHVEYPLWNPSWTSADAARSAEWNTRMATVFAIQDMGCSGACFDALNRW